MDSIDRDLETLRGVVQDRVIDDDGIGAGGGVHAEDLALDGVGDEEGVVAGAKATHAVEDSSGGDVGDKGDGGWLEGGISKIHAPDVVRSGDAA